MLLVVCTLGLALPWREAALERFKMRHSHYGDLQGGFEATGWEFFKRGFWLWLIAIAVLALPLIELTVWHRPPGSSLLAVGLITMIGAPFLYATFKAMQWRWWISGIRFGEVSFKSDLLASDLFGLYWKVVGWILLIMVLMALVLTALLTAAAFLGGGDGNLQQKFAAAAQQWPAVVATVVTYVLTALTATAVVRIYLIHDISARIAASTWVYNIAAADNVAAAGAAANAIGEGLADSLDIFGF